MTSTGAVKVLAGTTVVDLSQGVAGPLATRNLASMGARIIKIERPGVGDIIRHWDTLVSGHSSGHVWVNVGKESIEVDLASERGRQIVDGLLGLPNPVVIHNFVPGTVEKFGIDYESLRERHPHVIYCSISGYGERGEYRTRNAIDLIVQGESGVLLTNGTPEQPAKLSLSVCDIASSCNATIGILEAVLHRERTGEGQKIEISLLESVLNWSGYFPYMVWYQDALPKRVGLHHHTMVPYGPYRAADDRDVILAAGSGERSLWSRFCTALGHPELIDDPRYDSNGARLERREELDAVVSAAIAKRTAAEWIEIFTAHDVPCGLIRNLREGLDHPAMREVDAVHEIPSSIGPVKVLGSPIHSSVADHRIERGPAVLGEHTQAILEEIGLLEAAPG
jgi:crotonobetainyl-CoA:carnitine CoA-transferase CaiB-like acyl-CoA transferase